MLPELPTVQAAPRGIVRLHLFPDRAQKPQISRMMVAQNTKHLTKLCRTQSDKSNFVKMPT